MAYLTRMKLCSVMAMLEECGACIIDCEEYSSLCEVLNLLSKMLEVTVGLSLVHHNCGLI